MLRNVFEAPASASDQLEPSGLVTACIEQGAGSLMLDHGSLPDTFFDLSTGVAGEIVGRITLYGIRTAIVVPDLTVHSRAFQDFAHEANRSAQFRFFGARREAMDWLGARPG